MSQDQERTVEAPLPPSLAEILQKQGELLEQIVTDQDRPLALHELSQVTEGTKLPWTELNSREVARLVRWPTHHTWAGRPSLQFESGDSGDIKFFAKAVERTEVKDGQFYGLNNFWAILHTRPYAFDEKPPASTLEMAYAPMPALIRAWTAFPEFMDTLQRELKEVGALYQMHDVLTEQVEEEEPQLLRASRLAYGLLTRLMCKDDPEVQSRLQDSMFPDTPSQGVKRHFAPLTDPSRELWG